MTALVIRRVLRLLVVCVGVSLVTFSILHVSGDPVALMMPEAPEADRAVLRKSMGFEDPLPQQFARFIVNTATGNFGQSFYHRVPALGLVLERMPTTLILTLLAMALALLVALPVGIYSAIRRNSATDHVATAVVFLGQSMPVFWTGIMLILLFAVQWRLVPVSGWNDWTSAVLPALTLGTFSAPLLLRIVRSSMLEIINLDYVRTARAKGVSEPRVTFHHALRNAMIPVVTVAGVQLGYIVGGIVVVEDVFTLPGVGRLLLDAIFQRDYPVVQGVILILAAVFMTLNLAVDLLYACIDPRLRRG